MSFEETIIFYNPEHADQFTAKLKKSGFKTKSRRVSTLVRETLCTGKIDDFISLFNEEVRKYEDGSEKTDIQTLMSDMYNEIIDELALRKNDLSEFFDSVKPGESVFGNIELKGQADKKSGEEEKPENESLFHLLNENGLLEKNDNGYLLKESKGAGEIVTAVPSDMMLEASSPEKRAAYNINTIINVMSGMETHVTLPPEFILAAEPEIIDEIVEKFDVDEESVWTIKENGYIKSVLAERIIDYLTNDGKPSFEDIFTEMKNLIYYVENTKDEFRFDLDEKFLKEMLNDMKKMDLIKSKGNRYRLP